MRVGVLVILFVTFTILQNYAPADQFDDLETKQKIAEKGDPFANRFAKCIARTQDGTELSTNWEFSGGIHSYLQKRLGMVFSGDYKVIIFDHIMK